MGEVGTLWELSNKCELLWWGKCGDVDLLCPSSRVKCGNFASGKARRDWEQVVFLLDHEKIRKRSAGENEEVYVKIQEIFFSAHEIDHLSNISINRTVE